MSKKTQEKKANAKKTTTETMVSTKNYCCHCKHYDKIPHESGHRCKITGKPTPRKATCEKHDAKS